MYDPSQDIAILFHPKNIQEILATESISPEKVEVWMKSYVPNLEFIPAKEKRYFIPSYTNLRQTHTFGAGIVSRHFFYWNNYKADFSAMEDSFGSTTRSSFKDPLGAVYTASMVFTPPLMRSLLFKEKRMFFKKINRSPLVIEVADNQWKSFGDLDSFYHQLLHAYLMKNEGINESVPDGTYHFKIERRGLKLVTTLLPIE